MKKGVFYNGQFTAICWTAYFRWKAKNVKKKQISMRLLWKLIKCYTDDFKNKKMFFLTLLDSMTFLQKYFENFCPKFQIFFSKSVHCTLYNRNFYLKLWSVQYTLFEEKIWNFWPKFLKYFWRKLIESRSVRKSIFLFLKSSV